MEGLKTRSGKIYSIESRSNENKSNENKSNENKRSKSSLSVFYTLTINYIDDKVERMLPIKDKNNDIKYTYNTRSKAKNKQLNQN